MGELRISVRNIYKEFKLTHRKKQQLNLSVDKIIAVNDLSFDVYSGEILCLLGTNGAGKTTTMKILSTLMKPGRGSVLYYNKGEKLTENEARKDIAFLTSDLKLDDCFTANYLFDFFSSLYSVPKDVYQKRKDTLFGILGISDYSDIKIRNLSTGMKQKVSLAVSLAHNPNIIIFDEPTNGLDILSSKEIENFILKEKNNGKAFIISTHIFDLSEKLADRVIMIDDGKIIFEDSINTIMENGGMEKVFFHNYNHYYQSKKNNTNISDRKE